MDENKWSKTWVNLWCCIMFMLVQLWLPFTHHDLAEDGQWSDVPLKLLPSEAFDPAGQPCLPPRHDSVIAAPPNQQTQDVDISIFGSRNETKTLVCISHMFHCTCQWSRLTALMRGVMPRLLPCSTAAPWSNKRLQTDSQPLPAAAVRADTDMMTWYGIWEN